MPNRASCDVPLLEGENNFTFWALSSWGDSSRMGSLSARVDTRPPQIEGSLSGTPGEAGWYVSPVTFTAPASDPQPGSGIDTFTYTLNASPEQSYTGPITVGDGVHTLTFRAQDLAGHVSEISQSVQVDTIAPQVDASLAGEQANGWYLSQVTFTAAASDDGSGLARIEYALDGASWQAYTAPVTVGDGTHILRVRALDVAGNQAEMAPLSFQVDGRPPQIRVTPSWYLWERGEVQVRDGESGLVGVEVEIRDPQGRWPKVVRSYEAGGGSFATGIEWDRHFADGTLAPIGSYEVVVKAWDRAGNSARQTASLHIPAPNAPTYTPAPAPTALPVMAEVSSPTPVPLQLAMETALPTPTVLVSGFQTFATPPDESQWRTSPTGAGQSPVLWGMAAVGAIGVATAYALGQRRKRREEEAQQRAEAATEAARRNAAEEARKVRNWLQGKAMLEAQLREAQKAGASQEQIAALRQIGVTKGLGTALTAATVAIRLLFEKNRAESDNPHLSSGGGKGLASLVRQPYPDSLITVNDEPPTFWDKLKQWVKQLWDTFWNWVTGKPAMPNPTATPVVTPTIAPSHTSTPAPTVTPTATPTTPPTPTLTPTLSPSFQSMPGGYARYSPYWYGKSYFDILANTSGWWHNYQGQLFGMKTLIAAVYNYEIASFGNDPVVREYFTEAFARRYWQSQIDYGPDGAFWYLGGRDMVRLRVLNNKPGIYETDYDFSQAFREAERIMTNTAWQQGVTWTAPYDWGNPVQDKIDAIRERLPDFFKALLERRMGISDTQILYLSPGSINLTLADGTTVSVPNFFIVTKGQSVVLCQNRSCVNP